MATAQTDATIKNVFVMGHKPIAPPGKPIGSGADNIRDKQAGAFYQLLSGSPASAGDNKVRAYLSAHAHLWHYDADLAVAGLRGHIPQIVAGNGGSPPESQWRNQYFGFTVVSVMKSGKITAQSYGRPIPDPYYRQTPAPKPAEKQGPAEVLSDH